MIKKLKNWFHVISTGFDLATSKSMTYNFPPEMTITEKTRGRHILDIEKCRNCSLCAKICPNEAIEMVELKDSIQTTKKLPIYPQIDFSKCCFCGLCREVCPSGALQMTNASIIVGPDKNQFVYPPEQLAQPPELKMPEKAKIKNPISWARSRSLWIINYFTGCCFIEAVPWVSSGFDMERFGLIVARNPRMADVLLIGGYVTEKTVKRIIRIYNQMPYPKFVIALGNCPMNGGTYWDSYHTIKRIDDFIPIDIWIAGCPPRPEAIGFAIVAAINHIQDGYTGKDEIIEVPKKMELSTLEIEETLDPKEMVFNFGPQHPASGNFNLRIVANGEIIDKVTPQVGYLHRGFEKLMEYRTWYQNVMLIQRICVLDGASYEIGYSTAVEKLADIEVPEKAQYLRVIHAELSRIQSHLLNLGLMGGATGFHTMQMVTWGDREKILVLLDELSGGRIYHIYNVPGGVFRDLPETFHDQAMKVIKVIRNRLKKYDKLFINNPTFKLRTSGIGVVPSDVAIEYDLTGPNLRASGTKFDIRKNVPYAAYSELKFEIPTFKDSDAYHRTLCRRLEIEESLSLVEQALEKIPNGPFRNKFGSYKKKLPEGEAISFVESARGELCYHLVSNGDNKPYRAKVRGPTFDPILVLMPKILVGNYIADVPVIYWSLDNCPADHDR
ncbi:MAG: NADH-quinone oxidoreductase subunit D [Asgard group archaeon]|nr:NADH-quinone oxidoreductase subunit D [Asgard group archaeon]